MSDMIEKIKKYPIITFDIFNTLLMRSVAKPEDIFLKLGEELDEQGKLPFGMSPEKFMYVRKEAEDSIRRLAKRDIEYTFEDIYDRFPEFFGMKTKELCMAELETENRYTYLNPFINDVIREMKDEEKKIYLISDMYMSSGQIRELLRANGFDTGLVDGIYVSSEMSEAESTDDINKRNGKLFEVFLKNEGIAPDEVIHVGDDTTADVFGAEKAGIATAKYGIYDDLPMSFIYEQDCFDYGIPSLYSLRLMLRERLEHSFNSDDSVKTDADDFWFRQGALVWGPVLTMYAEWVLDIAKKNNIKKIFPLMREGVLLNKVLRKTAERRGMTDIAIRNLYVSRHTAALCRFDEFDEEVYRYCSSQDYVTISGVFFTLGIDVEQTPYADIKDKEFKTAKNEGLEQEIYNYLTQPENKQKIDEYIKQKKTSLFAYLQSVGATENFIACDIGYSGTISVGIEGALNQFGIRNNNTHCLLIGSLGMTRSILNGANIIGFLQENKDIVDSDDLSKYFRFDEGLFMDAQGTTLGYDDATHKPILAEGSISEEEKCAREAFQDGVMEFVSIYEKCPVGRLEETDKLSNTIKRLFLCPTQEEAKRYTSFAFDQLGGSVKDPIDLSEEAEICKQTGMDQYKRNTWETRMYWPEAVYSIAYPLHNYRKCLEISGSKDEFISAAMKLCEDMVSDGVEEFLIYGAGTVGRALMRIVELYDIKPLCAIDKKEQLWGHELQKGVKIISLDEAGKMYAGKSVVVATLAYVKEICTELEKNGRFGKVYRVS